MGETLTQRACAKRSNLLKVKWSRGLTFSERIMLGYYNREVRRLLPCVSRRDWRGLNRLRAQIAAADAFLDSIDPTPEDGA